MNGGSGPLQGRDEALGKVGLRRWNENGCASPSASAHLGACRIARERDLQLPHSLIDKVELCLHVGQLLPQALMGSHVSEALHKNWRCCESRVVSLQLWSPLICPRLGVSLHGFKLASTGHLSRSASAPPLLRRYRASSWRVRRKALAVSRLP